MTDDDLRTPQPTESGEPHDDSESLDSDRDADGSTNLWALLGYLESESGKQLVTHLGAALTSHVEGKALHRTHLASVQAEVRHSQHKMRITQMRLQVLGLACVLAAVVVLALLGKIEGTTTIALLGSLAGYFAGKNSSS
jgi:hypothetical protein